MKDNELNNLWEEVKNNQKKLDSCDGHAFEQHKPGGKYTGKWICLHCQGISEASFIKGYEQGVQHGETKLKTSDDLQIERLIKEVRDRDALIESLKSEKEWAKVVNKEMTDEVTKLKVAVKKLYNESGLSSQSDSWRDFDGSGVQGGS